jgi:broad specificity phosphatase PhoE
MKLSLSDPPADYFRVDKRLREMNFGKDEGRHFDSLPDEIKQNINSLEYQPEGGETWPQVSDRFLQLVGELSPGNYLVFTHGGLMCTQTWAWGVREVKRNCSAVCLRAEGGKVTGLEWVWEYDKERIG